MACASWKPVSLQDPQPYYPNYKIPSKAELDAMSPKAFNKWREKAYKMLLASFQKKWRYKHFTDEQMRYLANLYRDFRDAIFGTEDYDCFFKGKRYWDMSIDVEASWQASKPEWYRES